jgi:hypothetical protein
VRRRTDAFNQIDDAIADVEAARARIPEACVSPASAGARSILEEAGSLTSFISGYARRLLATLKERKIMDGF